MKLLLDTHVFLWYISADPKLPERFRLAIQKPDNEVYLSAASIWEAVIKHGLGKLPLPGPPAQYLSQQRKAHGIASLPILEEAVQCLVELPQIHRDPFDRILIAQALHHGLTIVTVDPDVGAYPVVLLSNT
ncbi:MAG TPA: PIN domain nuclease [Planctomycetaceae bacterium]|nr:PIN domain nuclease [Planctomycetaceae bacterium]